MADNIVRDQKAEIALMAKLKNQLAVGSAGDTLAMPKDQMDMKHGHGQARAGEAVRPPVHRRDGAHHMGAIAMAKMELKGGTNPQVRALARRIISAHRKEIKQMNSWYTEWYGGPVPSGSTHSHDGMSGISGMN